MTEGTLIKPVGIGSQDEHKPPAPPRLTSSQRVLILRVLLYGGLIVAWQVTAIRKGEFFLPTVGSTAEAFVGLFDNGYYLVLWPTLQQLAAGFAIAMALAVPIGVLMGRFRTIDSLLSPYMNALFVTSKEALLPLLIITFGIGFGYRVSVVVLFALFFPAMNTAAGVRYVSQELTETARAFNTPWHKMITSVYLPAAAPFVFAGTRLGLGMAIKGMVVAELWIYAGTGELLTRFTQAPRQLDYFYATVLLIVAVAITLDVGLKKLQQIIWPGLDSNVLAIAGKP